MASLLQSEPLFFLSASISTLLFLASFLYLLLMGGDGGHADGSAHVDVVDASAGDGVSHLDAGDASAADGSVDANHLDSAVAFKVFTTQSILAFFMGFGWLGLACRQEWDLGYLFSIGIASVFGSGLMLFTAYLMSQVYRLNTVRSRNLYRTLGEDATVYLTIPEQGKGKIQAVVDGSLKTVDAVSKSGKIGQFKDVEIVGVEDQSTLVVREK
jgi:hypothetical protein